MGLVNCTCSDAIACTRSKATAIVRAAPIALTQAKRAIDEGRDLDLNSAMEVEKRCYDLTIPTEDRLEALAAFREKRPPEFKGR